MGSVIDSVSNYLFEAASFMPHGLCLAWRPDLVAMHAAADLLIFVSYFTIPIALVYFLRRRTDLEYKSVFALFAAFILACGATHAFGLLTLWVPLYGLQGMVKVVTALVSVTTAILIWPIIPKALALPSPSQLRVANKKLQEEIEQRKAAEEELRRAYEVLEDRVMQRTFELQRSEERFRDFASTSADWFWEQDEYLRFKFISSSYEKITGIPSANHIGKTRRDVTDSGVDEADLAAHEAALEAREPFRDFRFTLLHRQGGLVHISVNGKPYFDDDGNFHGYRGSGRDITELVKAEELLMSERDKAEAASKSKSAFLANMSHEFRTPLNCIIGFSDLLTSEFSKNFNNEKREEITTDIHNASVHLLSLINDVLDLSRIEAGMENVDPEEIDLATTLRRSVKMISAEAEQRNIAIHMPKVENLPVLYADDRHLTQILLNVLSNAVKYNTDNGEVDISVQQFEDKGAAIVVRDTGVGISKRDIARVFDSFERVGDPKISSAGGTGLGLALAKRLADLNGGAITLESEPGKGSVVTIFLPSKGTVLETAENAGSVAQWNGFDARAFAAHRATELVNEGKHEAAALWRRIAAAISVMPLSKAG